MLPIVNQLRFFLYRHPTDMRKSFDGLFGIVSQVLSLDPLSGDVYVFLNRRRDRIKLLVWDRGGFWIFYKRLEKGRFQLPPDSSGAETIELPYEELMMLIEGIDLGSVKRCSRFNFSEKVLA
jgi:transposase